MPRELFEDDARITVLEKDLEGVSKPDPEVSYVIRSISDERWRELQRAHTTHTLNKQSGRRDPIVDWPKCSDDALDFLLLDWSGVVSRGQPVPCVRENKLRLDGMVKEGLFLAARTNQTTPEHRERSFRDPAAVRGTVD